MISTLRHPAVQPAPWATNTASDRRKRSFFVPLVCLLAGASNFLTGCATHTGRPATFTATQIRNPSIGYAGYELTVPEGFTVFDPTSLMPEPKASPFVVGVKKGYVAFLNRGGLDRLKKRPRQMFVERFLITSGRVAVRFTVSTWNSSMAFNQLSDKQMEDYLGRISTQIHRPSDPLTLGGTRFIRLGDRRGIGIDYQRQWHLPTGLSVPITGELLVVPGQLNEVFEIEGLAEGRHEAQMHQALRQIIANLRN